MRAELIDVMGDDLRVVNAARVSFDKQGDGSESDTKLIGYLADHGHWTPFSHPMVTLRETVPIFVARQRFKHMVGFAYNEVSRRYVSDRPEIYRPESFRAAPQGSIKQGSGDTHPKSRFWLSEYDAAMQQLIDLYDDMIAAGVAPEQARMILPQSMMTSYYVTGSLAAWGRAYRQRVDGHAQAEIQQLAHRWDELIRPHFPVSWSALTK